MNEASLFYIIDKAQYVLSISAILILHIKQMLRFYFEFSGVADKSRHQLIKGRNGTLVEKLDISVK